MDPQQQFFGLMTVAEDHQKAVKEAIDGLAKERAALAEAVARVVGVAALGRSRHRSRTAVGH